MDRVTAEKVAGSLLKNAYFVLCDITTEDKAIEVLEMVVSLLKESLAEKDNS